MSTTLRVLRWMGGGLLFVLVLVAAAAFLLLQTQPGHDFILRMALNQLPQYVNGEVEVEGLRSDGLLHGVTLHGISVRDAGGRPFVEADSLRVQYSLRDLLRRELVLVPAEVWRPRVTIETLHGDTGSNVQRIFAGPEDDEPGEGAGFTVALRNLVVHDGEVVIRLPAENGELDSRMVTEVSHGEGEFDGETLAYRVFRFTEMDLWIVEADLLGPDREGERVEFGSLSLTGHVFDEPFHLEDLRGVLTREGSRVTLDADRIWLPGSELSGRVAVDWGELELDVELDAPVLQLGDLRWIDQRIPDGEGRLTLEGGGPLDQSRWRITAADIEVGGSRVVGDVGVDLGEESRLTETSVELLPLELSELDPWLAEPLPVPGRVRGRLRAEGPFSALSVVGDLSYEDPERDLPTPTVEFDGIVHLHGDPEVSDLSLTVDPLDYRALGLLLPDFPVIGEGRVQVEASGGLASALHLTAEIEHRIVDGPEPFASRITLVGSIREEAEEIHLSLDGMLGPLSLDGLAAGVGREFPVSGELTGPVRADGPLRDLGLSGRLATPAGTLVADARFDVGDPARHYQVDGSLEGFRMHELVEALPDPTVVNGTFFLDGEGLELEELAGALRLALHDSNLGGAEVDRLDAHLIAEGGRLLIDELDLVSSVLLLSGRGDLALREGESDGEITVIWESESLAAIRPIFLGDGEGEEVIAADTLTELERDILRMDGVEPETLGTGDQLVLEGSAFGELVLRGGVTDLRATGFSELEDAVLGGISVAHGRVDFLGRWTGRDDWEAEGVLDIDEFGVGGFTFLRGSGEVGYSAGSGEFRVDVQRSEMEGFHLGGEFEHDSLQVAVGLETLILDFDDVEWRLAQPARLLATRTSIDVDLLRLVRPSAVGSEELRMEARGVLNLEGDSDLVLQADGVDLQRLGQILQSEELPTGTLDLDVAIRGPAGAPTMDGTFLVRDFSANGATLSLVEGTLTYADELVHTSVLAEIDGRPLLSLEGRVPANLSFQRVEDRFPDRNVDLTLVVDSLPAATAVGFLDVLEDVEGSLTGTIQLQGTPQELRPSGELQLRGGALVLAEQGVRTTDISADLRLREDRIVEVEGTARARGTARVSGTISLEDPADPVFDLGISASGFQAVERRDLTARVGGDVALTGSFSGPRVGGTVRVEEGSIFLEELARTAEVIDLTDPAFFDVVDTTLVAVRPVVEAAQNPFVQNLRVDVDLEIQSDFWLRSREMDVEMGGELIVTFDRPARELLLLGSLQATRGSYTAFGRQFQVVEGSVEFVGTPGINPSLNIQAINRLRRDASEPLNIIAQVEGTLVAPQVTLTTDSQPPIAESDLLSYLIFGRPSYALASGETSVLQGAAGAGVSVGIGTLATQLGTVVARQFGVDYFSITQAQEGGGLQTASGLGGTFADTQIEVGQYVGQDLFLALILRPLTGLGARTQTQFPGARLEWRFTDTWTMEGFVEDRFAREGVSGFGELGIRLSKVVGLSVFREWGY